MIFLILYIDAKHYESAVFNDLLLWKNKLNFNGILAGHDFCFHSDARKINCDVINAVKKFLNITDFKLFFISNDVWPSYFLARKESVYMKFVLNKIGNSTNTIISVPFFYVDKIIQQQSIKNQMRVYLAKDIPNQQINEKNLFLDFDNTYS